MLCSEIFAVCSKIYTKYIYKLCGQNVEFLVLKLVVYNVNTRFKNFKKIKKNYVLKTRNIGCVLLNSLSPVI